MVTLVPLSRKDAFGAKLRVGDWVRVISVPLNVRSSPEETQRAFCEAVNHTFQIEGFDPYGCLELDINRKVGLGTIWIEPFCVKRFRRYHRLSKAFKRLLKWRNAPRPPRYQMKFKIRLRRGVDPKEFIFEFDFRGMTWSWAEWPEENRIEGSFFADLENESAREILENARNLILRSRKLISADFSEISEDTMP